MRCFSANAPETGEFKAVDRSEPSAIVAYGRKAVTTRIPCSSLAANFAEAQQRVGDLQAWLGAGRNDGLRDVVQLLLKAIVADAVRFRWNRASVLVCAIAVCADKKAAKAAPLV